MERTQARAVPVDFASFWVKRGLLRLLLFGSSFGLSFCNRPFCPGC